MKISEEGFILAGLTAINLASVFIEKKRLSSLKFESIGQNEIIKTISLYAQGIPSLLIYVFGPFLSIPLFVNIARSELSACIAFSASLTLAGALFYATYKIARFVSDKLKPEPIGNSPNIKWKDSRDKKNQTVISLSLAIGCFAIAIIFSSPIFAINSLISAYGFLASSKRRELQIHREHQFHVVSPDGVVVINGCTVNCYLACIPARNAPNDNCGICTIASLPDDPLIKLCNIEDHAFHASCVAGWLDTTLPNLFGRAHFLRDYYANYNSNGSTTYTPYYKIQIPKANNKMYCCFCTTPSEAIKQTVRVDATYNGRNERLGGRLVFT